jgi:hypothetical protein
MTSLVNKTNAHTGGFLSSNEGPIGGCTGKGMGVNGCGIKMYHGLVGQSGGKKSDVDLEKSAAFQKNVEKADQKKEGALPKRDADVNTEEELQWNQ